MLYPWLALVPPVFVIILTIITRNVLLSLAGGILGACFIATDGNLITTITLAIQRIIEETDIMHLFYGGDIGHVYTFIFLILLGILIQLMNHSGGIRAYTVYLLNFVTTGRAAQQTALALSTALFIDDYVGNLTVGAIMRPVTDHFKIARVKLAFLLDAMSGPMCILVPASSWVAFILAQMQSSGISLGADALVPQDAYFIYLACIPYILYPILIITLTWVIVSGNFGYGAMAAQEKIAQTTGNLFGGKPPLTPARISDMHAKGTILDFILPIATFILTFLAGIAYSGNSVIFGGTAGFIVMLQVADPFWSLAVAALVAVVLSLALFVYQNPNLKNQALPIFYEGFILMKNSLLVLLLAWTLSTLLKNDLHTGTYLANLLPTQLPLSYLPIMLFVFCALISGATGSVWGTIALMLPITIPLYVQLAPTLPLHALYPILGGLFSGSVAGSHFSPISDAMILSSFSAGCYHLDHVRTHISYAICALIGALSGYALLMILPSEWSYALSTSIVLFASVTSMFLTFFMAQKLSA